MMLAFTVVYFGNLALQNLLKIQKNKEIFVNNHVKHVQ